MLNPKSLAYQFLGKAPVEGPKLEENTAGRGGPGKHTGVGATGGRPHQVGLSVTWDQGTEMSLHKEISIAADLDVYFCDPHSPWQRGPNENTNGLLRQYFPKSTDLSVHGLDRLRDVERMMNNRPCKALGWASPAEAMWAELDDILGDA